MCEGCTRFFQTTRGRSSAAKRRRLATGRRRIAGERRTKFSRENLEFVKIELPLQSRAIFLGEISSAGSERLPYKQRVGGSNPSAPTSETKHPDKATRKSGFCCVGMGGNLFAGICRYNKKKPDACTEWSRMFHFIGEPRGGAQAQRNKAELHEVNPSVRQRRPCYEDPP